MIEKILVPTDGSAHARKTIDFASDIALKYDAKIYLIHVVRPVRVPVYAEEVEAISRKAGEEILEEAELEMERKGVKIVESKLIPGDPAKEILQFAKKNRVDIIFMGSHGMGELEGVLLGSVSHKVCHLAECTCVTVK